MHPLCSTQGGEGTGEIQFDGGVTQSHGGGGLIFVETAVFTRLITELISDDDYAAFQDELSRNPDKSGPMAGCGGVRKARMALPGRGKSGGARVVYLYLRHRGIIYLIYVFTKGEAESLSAAQKSSAREIAQQFKNQYHA